MDWRRCIHYDDRISDRQRVDDQIQLVTMLPESVAKGYTK